MDCCLLGSSTHGIFQARILEWVSISFYRGLPNSGIKPWSPTLQADSLPSEPPGKPTIVWPQVNSRELLELTPKKRCPFHYRGLECKPSHVWLFVTPWTAAHQASLSLTIFWSSPKFISVALVMPSNHLILCHPLLLPSIFTSIRLFHNESGVCIRWPVSLTNI